MGNNSIQVLSYQHLSIGTIRPLGKKVSQIS